MQRTILFHGHAHDAIRRGLSTVGRAARVTLGPRGKHVLLERGAGAPLATKDGVTVVNELTLEDAFENIGAKLLRQVASATGDTVGDGTTTATILAEAMFREGLKAIVAGINPIHMCRGMERAVEDAVRELTRLKLSGDDEKRLESVAMVAANGDETLGKLVAQVFRELGPQAVVSIEEGKSAETKVEWVSGQKFDRGYLSPLFVNDRALQRCVLEDARVLICDHKISRVDDIRGLVEAVLEAAKPLLVVAEDIEGEALATLAINTARGVLAACAVKAPGFGEQRRELLLDLAAATNGQLVSNETGDNLSNVSFDELGVADRVVVERDTTTIIGGNAAQSSLSERLAALSRAAVQAPERSTREKLHKRMAALQGKAAVIQVGGATDSEIRTSLSQLDDTVHAARAALEEGVVVGGGVALLRATAKLNPKGLADDEAVGYRIVVAACREPSIAIADNAGRIGTAVCSKILESDGLGYNAASDQFEDLVAAGILDPLKVTRLALSHAAELAALLLTSDALIANDSSKS